MANIYTYVDGAAKKVTKIYQAKNGKLYGFDVEKLPIEAIDQVTGGVILDKVPEEAIISIEDQYSSKPKEETKKESFIYKLLNRVFDGGK